MRRDWIAARVRASGVVISCGLAAGLLAGCDDAEGAGQGEASGAEAAAPDDDGGGFEPVGALGEDDSDEVQTIVVEGATDLSFLRQTKVGSTWNYSDPFTNPDLRVNGVALYPLQRIVVAAVDNHPLFAENTRRRVQTLSIDVNPSSTTRGEVVNANALAYTNGSINLRGVSATSYDDGAGNVDGLFAFVDTSPKGLYVMDVQGEGPSDLPSTMKTVSGLPVEFDASKVPAVEYGKSGETGKILLTHVWKAGTTNFIDFGFLTRNAAGNWSYSPTGWVTAAPTGENCTHVVYNVAAAFDANRAEWGVAWQCDAVEAYMVRVDWNGNAKSSQPFRIAWYPEAAHSGTWLSFNRDTDRYFVNFQHNAAVVWPSGNTLTCTTDSGGNCADRVLGCLAGREQVNTSEADYWWGWEFRAGGQSTSCPGATYLSGLSAELRDEPDAARTVGWQKESGQLFAAPPSGEAINVHRFVRSPWNGVAAALQVQIRPAQSFGLLKSSLVDEASGKAHWE